ncbi:MAG: HAD-IIB family hydrolase [Oscillospiraceae bacterium]
MKIEALLLDMDGTTLQDNQVYISEKTMRAVKAAIAKGIYVVPCTGRALDMLPPQIAQISDVDMRYCITSHGARVVDRRTKASLYTNLIAPGQAAEICRIFENQNIYAEIAFKNDIYMEQSIVDTWREQPVPAHHIWYVEAGMAHAVPLLSGFFAAADEGVEKFNLYGIPPEKQRPIYDAITATGFVSHTRPGINADLEFLTAAIDKSEAVSALLAHLQIPMENVMICGDSSSDVAIIRKAGVGVAMGNAPGWIKQDADYVTASNAEDGVAQAIAKFILEQ